MDFGCASYCQYAEQCLGDLPPELIAQKEDLLKDRVAIEMKRHYKSDFKRIGHATRVARYAERIGKERRGNLAVILCAAYLLNIDQETERAAGASPVEAILQKLGAREKLIEEVVAVVARNGSAPTENDNYQVVNDAELLARIEARHKAESLSRDQLEQLLQASLVTTEGLKIAREVLHLPSRSQ
jgi:HD superfamily phosphodiesterase